MDKFFSQKYCDRCGGSLESGRMMSKFNEDCLCMDCIQKERQRDDYKAASDAEIEAVRNGNFNFKGVGLNESIKK